MQVRICYEYDSQINGFLSSMHTTSRCIVIRLHIETIKSVVNRTRSLFIKIHTHKFTIRIGNYIHRVCEYFFHLIVVVSAILIIRFSLSVYSSVSLRLLTSIPLLSCFFVCIESHFVFIILRLHTILFSRYSRNWRLKVCLKHNENESLGKIENLNTMMMMKKAYSNITGWIP